MMVEGFVMFIADNDGVCVIAFNVSKWLRGIWYPRTFYDFKAMCNTVCKQ